MQLKPDTVFANRYELIRLLGRGGFAEVWLARNNLTGLEDALKVYAPDSGMDEDGLKSFIKELSVVHDLHHTNLLTPNVLDQFENQPYLVLPYCPNGSLVKRVGACTETEAWQIIRQVAAGLAYLHANDIIHQDIKPDNILIDKNGNYVITDFGISLRARSTLRKSVSNPVQSGTPAYIAPERFSSEPKPLKASDIWSLGITMYELLEGDVPFMSMGGLAQKNGADMPNLHAEVSDELKQTIISMLSLDPAARPTAEQLAKTEHTYSVPVKQPTPVQTPVTPPVPERPTQPMVHDSLMLSSETISATDIANKYLVEIHSNSPWDAKSGATWVKYEKTSETELLLRCERNKEWETRTAIVHVTNADEHKSITITQPADKKYKSKMFGLFMTIVTVVFVIFGGTAAYMEYNRNQSVQNQTSSLKERHTQAINDFNNYLSLADIEHPEMLSQALKYLKIIEQIEDHANYDGYYAYGSKRIALREKAQALYEEANRKYEKAPDGTDLKRKNKEKLDRIIQIKAQIP